MNLKDKIITSNRGKEKIAYQNYFYNYKELRGNKLLWRCNNKKCKAFIYTDTNYNLLDKTSHNHVTNEIKFKNIVFQSKLKEKALIKNDKPRDLILEVANSDFKGLPFNYVKSCRTVVEFRNRNNFTYKDNYDIPIEITVTKKMNNSCNTTQGLWIMREF